MRQFIGAFCALAITVGVSGAEGRHGAMEIVRGKLTVNGTPYHDELTAVMDHPGYIYLAVPDHGLFVISSHQFTGASVKGVFAGCSLSVKDADTDLALTSSRDIISHVNTEAWVRHYPLNSFNTRSVLFGVGDREQPDGWIDQLRNAQQR